MSDNTTPHLASEYNTKIGKTIPYYQEFHMQAIDLVKQKSKKETWLDLGCGTGTFERLIMNSFPEIKIIALDLSEKMIDEAKKNLKDSQIEYICQSSVNIDYENIFDVVTAIQVHHYLNKEEREKATRKVFRALKRDGIYISFENVIPENSEMKKFELERWKRYQMVNGKSEEEATSHINRCGVNYFPITVNEHIDLLKRTGFKCVYVFWKSYMQMGIMGIK